MARRRVALAAGLLWLMLALPASAAPDAVKTVTINTWPKDADVYLVSPQGLELLGHTGTPLRLEFRNTVMDLVVKHSGYSPNELRINEYFIQDGSQYPPHGVIRLNPLSAWSDLEYVLWDHILLVSALGTALLLGFVFLVLPRLRRLNERLRQGALLEDMVASDETMDHMCGRRLGKYRVAGRVAEGGFAVVYRAVPNDSLRKEDSVAIKVMKKDTFVEPELRARFRREVMILRELNHPAIARILDWGEQKGLLYLVIELAKGQTLRDFIRPTGVPLTQAMPMLKHLFSAIAYIHKKDVVHRNLKPENVVVMNHGEKVKIIDFGLARGQQSVRLTRAGVVLGTPAYMAPEQIKGQPMDQRVDQYASATMIFELLTGKKPFKASNRMTLMYMQISERPPQMTSIRPDLPAALDEVVGRMMAKDPKERFPDMDEAWSAFQVAASCQSPPAAL